MINVSFLVLLLFTVISSLSFAQSRCEELFAPQLWGGKFYHAYTSSQEPQTLGVEVEALVPKKYGLEGIVKVLVSELQRDYKEVHVEHTPTSTIEYRVHYQDKGEKKTLQIHHDWYVSEKSSYIDAEISSPILRNKHELQYFLNLISHIKNKLHLKQAPTKAGVHIHVGFSKTSPAEVSFMLLLFSAIEKQLHQIFSVTKNRWNDSVAYTSDGVLYYLKNTPVSSMELGTLQNINSSNKNYGLNIRSLARYNTLEFRLFNSSVNSEHIQMMVDLVSQLTYAVRTKDPRLTQFLTRSKSSEQINLQELAHALELPIFGKNKRFLRAIKYQAIRAELLDAVTRNKE